MTKNKQLNNIGIVGCGHIALSHLPAIKKALPNANMSFCDLNEEAARALAKKNNGGKVYTDFDQMLEEENLDSVHILTSAQSHFFLSKKALEANCHVLVEKPATESMAELNELLAIADKNDLLFSVDHTLLGMPVVLKAMEEIKSGSMGRLVSAHCDFGGSRGHRLPYDPGHWAYDMRGASVANNISHPASLIVELMDPITDLNVQAVTRNVLPTKWPDLVHITVKSEDQISAFALSMGHGNGDRRAHLLFEKGYISLDFGRQLYTSLNGTWPLNFVQKATSGMLEGGSNFFSTIINILKVLTGRLPSNPGLFNIVANFYRSIDSGEELLVSRKNLVTVTQLLEDVWNSVEQNEVSNGQKATAKSAPKRKTSRKTTSKTTTAS